MIYVYSDCDNAVACRDKAVLETYFDMDYGNIETLPDDSTKWGEYPIMPIDTWMIEQPGGVLILVDTLSDLETLD